MQEQENLTYRFPASLALLPEEVKQELSQAILYYPKTRCSILEVGHRSSFFKEILEEAIFLTQKILKIPRNFSIFFLQGSSSFGFAISAYNAQKKYKKVAFLESDFWSSKALETTESLGLETVIVGSSKFNNFHHLPIIEKKNKAVDYLHFTSNNTIAGTQYQTFPISSVPLVADMTSDIFTRDLDFSNAGIFYAGLQKSLCANALGLYIVREDWIEEKKDVPKVFQFFSYKKENGIYHTPNIFGIFTALLMLRWMDQQGGISFFSQKNREKAQLIYEALEQNPYFKLLVKKEDRSLINIIFDLGKNISEETFKAKLNKNIFISF